MVLDAPAAALRQALGSFLTGVTVVTTCDSDGSLRGLTANSFTSVSLEPPLVLVCIDQGSASYQAFANSDGFAVSILAADQVKLANRFASRNDNKFAGVATRPGITGAPILENCTAWLDCQTVRSLPLGDHIIIVGRVHDFGTYPSRPLGYCQGGYVMLDSENTIRQLGASRSVLLIWICELDEGVILTRLGDTATHWSLPGTRIDPTDLSNERLNSAAERSIGITIGSPFLFSSFHDPNSDMLVLAYRTRVAGRTHSGNVQKLAAGCEVFEADDLPWAELPNDYTKGMLRRYLRERAAGRFGIYAGTASTGRVAVLDSVDTEWISYMGEPSVDAR